MLTLQELALDEVDGYLANQSPRYGTVKAIMLHHTYRPNQTTHPFHGLSSMKNIQAYHRSLPRVRDIMANLYVTPTGTVWTARPLDWDNWAHAYVKLPWSQVEPEAKEIAYPDKQFFNHYSIGIEMVANFDAEPVEPVPTVLETALDVICLICLRWELGPEHIFFHRDVSPKSCPGKQLGRAWVRERIGAMLGSPSQQVKVILRPNQLVGTLVLPAGGTIVVPEHGDHREDQGKLYLDRLGEGG